jgi:hypothetical protein
MAKTKKKFKLVYLKNGTLSGSYSGIPSKDDVELIKRSVLEGEELPDPKPEGEIKITENGIYDVSAKASANVNVQGGGPEPVGNKDITTTERVDVREFATAQVKENNLVAENIKSGVSILGVVGTLEDSLEELMQESF